MQVFYPKSLESAVVYIDAVLFTKTAAHYKVSCLTEPGAASRHTLSSVVKFR